MADMFEGEAGHSHAASHARRRQSDERIDIARDFSRVCVCTRSARARTDRAGDDERIECRVTTIVSGELGVFSMQI